MSTLAAITLIGLAGAVAFAFFKVGQEWERGKPPKPIDLATYIPPQLPKERETEPIAAWFEIEALDTLS